MKQIALFIGFFLLITPNLAFAQAQSPSCSAQGYTVVFVNGVFDTYLQAQADSAALENYLKKSNLNQPINVQLGYNPTHLAGLGDSLQSIWQQFNSSLSDFDLDTILMQIYPEVTTRKLLVVGHSQGADYANEMYDYLLAHGEPKDAVGVYAVGTPASFVAGGGKYITSTNDKVINWADFGATVAGAQLPLPSNVSLPLSAVDQTSIIGGHSFTNDYLANASTQMIDDIDSELANLVPTEATQSGDCFTPPDASVGYKTQQVLFAVADPTAIVIKVGGITAFNATALALNTATNLAVGAFQFVADSITLGADPPSQTQATQKTDAIINKLYGSSLDGLSPDDKKQLLGTSQGGAVVLALSQDNPVAVNGGLVEGTSTSVSNLANSSPATTTPPRTSFIQGQSSPTPVVVESDESSDSIVSDTSTTTTTVEDTATSTPDIADATTTEDATTTQAVIIAPTPPAIAINEIEWAGDAIDPGREWIELKKSFVAEHRSFWLGHCCG